VEFSETHGPEAICRVSGGHRPGAGAPRLLRERRGDRVGSQGGGRILGRGRQISDGLTTEGANALTALNKVIDESIEPRGAIAVLKRYADAAKSAEMRLGRLKAPASAESTADGLAFLIAALERSIEFTATDIRIARREREDVAAVARSGDRVISAHQSGVRALSLALRALANVSVNGT